MLRSALCLAKTIKPIVQGLTDPCSPSMHTHSLNELFHLGVEKRLEQADEDVVSFPPPQSFLPFPPTEISAPPPSPVRPGIYHAKKHRDSRPLCDATWCWTWLSFVCDAHATPCVGPARLPRRCAQAFTDTRGVVALTSQILTAGASPSPTPALLEHVFTSQTSVGCRSLIVWN